MHERDRGDGVRRFERLRWRLRGAWQWPTFVAATLLEMVLLHLLPVQGDATGWVAALLVAGCLNLIALVLLGAIGGTLVRRRRPDMPKVVADDYAGTVVLGIVAASLLVAGLLHRPAITQRREAFEQQSLAVQRWVATHANAYARAHVGAADSVQLDEDLFRTCVPQRDPKRSLCLVVDTARSPPAVRRDDSREPNDAFIPR